MSFVHFCALTQSGNRVRQFKIHFWKTAKKRMSIYFSCGTRSSLQSCPHTAKDTGASHPLSFLPSWPPGYPKCLWLALQDRNPYTRWALENMCGEHYTLEFPCHCREKRDKRIKTEKINAAFNSHLYIEAEGYKSQTRSGKWMKNRHHINVPHHPSSHDIPCVSPPVPWTQPYSAFSAQATAF